MVYRVGSQVLPGNQGGALPGRHCGASWHLVGSRNLEIYRVTKKVVYRVGSAVAPGRRDSRDTEVYQVGSRVLPGNFSGALPGRLTGVHRDLGMSFEDPPGSLPGAIRYFGGFPTRSTG